MTERGFPGADVLRAHLALNHHPQHKVLLGTGLGTCPSQRGCRVLMQEEGFLCKNPPPAPRGARYCQHCPELQQGWDRALA